MKIKGYRFPCEVCGNNKIVSSIQVFFRENGEVSYDRARHLGANKKFYYHQQSLDYVNAKLREISNIDHCQAINTQSIGQVNTESSSKLVMVRLPGFEPGSSAWEADVLPN
jgi:hypothetical protein